MKPLKKAIYVTQPDLPNFEDFIKDLKVIWESKWLTNNGSFHQKFEAELAEYLGVKYISLFSNGTLALITALQSLEITGEVITTPFSFVASTHALNWNGITPVFCDIDSHYFNLDPEKIEALITPRTSAILAVHVYGNPAESEKILEIADKHHLKVIFDAAHAFGVKKNGLSILNHGDLSILSFHATKAFNTIEGGAIICHDLKTKQHIDHLKNFGIKDEVTVVGPGINAKMNELSAAYGLLQLKDFNTNKNKRKEITNLYRLLLKNTKGIRILDDMHNVEHNYSYFPIIVEDEYQMSRDKLYFNLRDFNIYGRRYFYPLISNFSTYNKLESSNLLNLEIANDTSLRVICLPIYSDLSLEIVKYICDIINE